MSSSVSITVGDANKQGTLPTINVISLSNYGDYKSPKKCNSVSDCEKSVEDPDSDIISNCIGHYGLWQFVWTFILCMFQLPNTFHIFSIVFQTAEKDFWCARPDNMMDMDVSTWRNLTQPEGSCKILDLNSTLLHSGNLEIYLQLRNDLSLTKCKQFEYANDTMGATLAAEFNLVCDRSSFSSVVEMCFLAGAAVGSVSSGWISDKFGRKHTLMVSATIQSTIGTLLAFSSSLPMFMALRVVIGFASMTVTVVSFVLVVELVSGKWRTIIGILNIMPVALSYTITSGIAYLTRDWRLMQLVISVPWFALLLIWYCLPESPRWLLARGRTPELIQLIERAARMNRRTLPPNYEKTLEAYDKDNEIAESSPLTVVFSRRFRRTTLLTLIVWFTLIILYFGLTLHLSNLGGNIYLNTAIAGIVEAFSIGLSIFVVLKLGIRLNLVIYMIVAGVACLLVNLVPEGHLWGVITLAMIGKCSIGANNAIIPIFTAQQYPTVVRNFGVGVGNFAAGVGLILVPYMWLLEHVQIYLPMTLMGFSGLIGAVALLLMKKEDPINT